MGNVISDEAPALVSTERTADVIVASGSGEATTFANTPSLHGNMMREQDCKNPLDFYKPVKVIGEGSMGSVVLVQRKESAIGGSARPDFVRYHSTLSPANSGGFFSFFQPKKSEPRKYHHSPSSLISYGRKETTYALKSLHLDMSSDPALQQEIKNEVAILKEMDHPNIVKAYETFHLRNRVYIVLELCGGGDLYSRDPYTEAAARDIMRSMMSAVTYMHSKKIIHRDLKYENIMFASAEENSQVKVIDFGLSKKYAPDSSLRDMVGTAYTMAPELLKGRYSNKVDVWSMGVVAFMLLSSSMPFYGRNNNEILRQIIKGDYSFSNSRWKTVSAEAKSFVEAILITSPSRRPSARKTLKLPWLCHSSSDSENDLDPELMDRVQASMQSYAEYGLLKKLALMVIAYKLTHKRIGFLAKLFERFDEVQDGELTLEEFKRILDDYEYTEQELERLFHGIDLDGTGVVHYSEFLAATIEAHGSIEEEEVAEAFDRLDSDDSGYITIDNIRTFLGKDIPQKYARQIMGEGDRNNDNRISYEEFLGLWDRKYDKERTAVLRKVKGRRKSIVSADSTSLRSEESFGEVFVKNFNSETKDDLFEFSIDSDSSHSLLYHASSIDLAKDSYHFNQLKAISVRPPQKMEKKEKKEKRAIPPKKPAVVVPQLPLVRRAIPFTME